MSTADLLSQRIYPLLVLLIAAAVTICIRGSAHGQDIIPPVPDLGVPYFFVDFDYPVPGLPPDPGTDPFTFDFPAGNVFGDNRWLTAAGPGDSLKIEQTRGWYAYDWLEYRGPGHIWNYDNPPDDKSWFDAAGVYVSGDLDEALRDHDAIRRLIPQDDRARVNLLLFRGEAGTYQGRSASLRISSGFAARTGTWTARVLLPDFDGLRHHEPVDGEQADISFFPAFWLQSSEYFLEDREPVYPEPGPRVSREEARAAWSEANYEFNNWFDPDRPDGHRAISADVTWANPCWSTLGRNPSLGVAGRNGASFPSWCRIMKPGTISSRGMRTSVTGASRLDPPATIVTSTSS